MKLFRNKTSLQLNLGAFQSLIEEKSRSFAHLALRVDADRYLKETEDLMLRKGGDLYILDEVYGEYFNGEVVH